jgi:hypothetical protein
VITSLCRVGSPTEWTYHHETLSSDISLQAHVGYNVAPTSLDCISVVLNLTGFKSRRPHHLDIGCPHHHVTLTSKIRLPRPSRKRVLTYIRGLLMQAPKFEPSRERDVFFGRRSRGARTQNLSVQITTTAPCGPHTKIEGSNCDARSGRKVLPRYGRIPNRTESSSGQEISESCFTSAKSAFEHDINPIL